MKRQIGTLCGFFAISLLFPLLASLLLRNTLLIWIFLILGTSSLCVFCIFCFQDLVIVLQSRQTRYGTNVAISVLSVAGLSIFTNLIVLKRFDHVIDLTGEKWYTLSPQTQKVIEQLNQPVEVKAFFSQNPSSEREKRDYDRAKELLKMYQRASDKINVSFVDTFTEVQTVEKYEIRNNGTLVFESKGNPKHEFVHTVDEQKFTSALLKITRDTEQRVYFLVGHGERSTNDFSINGYNQAKEELEKQNYVVYDLSLTSQRRVPPDCSVLIIAAPKRPLSENELSSIERYMNRSGKIMVMLDPTSFEQRDQSQGLIDLLARWGVQVNNDYVVVLDRRFFSAFGGPATPVFMNFDFHPITQHLVRPTVVFQLTRSVFTKTEGLKKRISVQPLAKLPDFDSNICWGETEQSSWQEAKYDKAKDTAGPISIAVAAESEANSRIVVVGDADFASNQFFSSTSGGDFFLGSTGWLTMEGDLISIRPVDPRSRSLRNITAGEQILIQLVSVFLIPFLISIIGFTVWWKRR